MHVSIINEQEQADRLAQRPQLSRARLARIARAVMKAEGCEPGTELSVAIGDDAWIADLSRRYKRRNRPTDVLAFPQDTGPPEANPVPGGERGRIIGDVAISAESAARQARQAGHSFAEEMALLVTHGILHLTGWRDNTAVQRRRMMRRARELLERIGEWRQ